MSEAAVYLTAIGFLISVFPIYIYNYVYINTEQKFAGVNVALYRFWVLLHVNTVKDKPREMQINGKNKKIDASVISANSYKFFNRICIYKIVQLGDFGIKNENNVYAALGQNALSMAIYTFLRINRNYGKLKNYIILNEEHGFVRYFAKAVTVVNLIVVSKLILLYFWEKINER